MDKQLSRILYSINLIAALSFFLKCAQNFIQGSNDYQPTSIAHELQIHRLNTFLRFCQLALITLGKVPGKPFTFASLFMDRATLSIIFLSPQADRQQYLYLGMLYSFVDSIKYLYFLFPQFSILSILKYNLPLLSNILIPFLSVSLMKSISYQLINTIRVVQLWYLVHGVINYRILLREKREWEQVPAKIKQI